MNNKILVSVYVAELNEVFELFVPVNETISDIKDLIIKAISELFYINFKKTSFSLFDPETSKIYYDELLLLNTNIVNTKKVILM